MKRSVVSRSNKQPGGLALVLVTSSIFAACDSGSKPMPRMITAETLVDKYSVSVDAARHEFDSDDLVVEGYVLTEVTMPKNDVGEGVVLLGAQNGGFRGVQCWFTRYESAEFVGVERGNLITVKGTFNGEAGPMLKFCKLLQRTRENDAPGQIRRASPISGG